MAQAICDSERKRWPRQVKPSSMTRTLCVSPRHWRISRAGLQADRGAAIDIAGSLEAGGKPSQLAPRSGPQPALRLFLPLPGHPQQQQLAANPRWWQHAEQPAPFRTQRVGAECGQRRQGGGISVAIRSARRDHIRSPSASSPPAGSSRR
jgi:hypothetical protein